MEIDFLSEHVSFLLQSNILLQFKHNKDPQQSPMKVSVFCITSAKSSSCKLLLRYRFSEMRNCNLNNSMQGKARTSMLYRYARYLGIISKKNLLLPPSDKVENNLLLFHLYPYLCSSMCLLKPSAAPTHRCIMCFPREKSCRWPSICLGDSLHAKSDLGDCLDPSLSHSFCLSKAEQIQPGPPCGGRIVSLETESEPSLFPVAEITDARFSTTFQHPD